MSEEPGVEELRGRIVQTRADLGETVGALAAKVDVKARATSAVHEVMDGAKAKAQNAVDGVKGAVGTATAKGRNAVGTAGTKAQDAVEGARTRSQDAVASARSTAQDVAVGARDRARELAGHQGKHSAGSLTIEGDTALVTRPRTDPQAAVAGALLVTSVGALVSALVVWLTRPRS
jgi:Protein of unknown function (DUF3618)